MAATSNLKFPIFSIPSERRRDKRFSLARPGKAFRRATGRFVPVLSQDVSLGGALLQVFAERPFAIGEIVDLGIDYSGTGKMVREDALQDGIVVRADALEDGRQAIAVRYLGREAMAKAA